jgi:Domain of unknown function (DUF4383)
MAKKISLLLGIVFLLVGVAGFVLPNLLGTHLSLAHNLVHIISGAVAIYFGTAGSVSAARSFCILFGIVYGLLGVAGFLLGAPGTVTMAGMENMSDGRLFKVIPGQLEFGTMDHIVHVLLGTVFLIGGLTTRKDAVV